MSVDSIDALPADATLGAASAGLAGMTHLSNFFADRAIVRDAWRWAGPASSRAHPSAWLGWGNRPSGSLARRLAAEQAVPFALLEDGFLRSVGLGKAGAPTVSIVADDVGVYYDAARPSRLERLVAAAAAAGPRAEASAALALWRTHRLSKYNIGDDRAPNTLFDKILLVDQVRGDASVAGAGATTATFQRLLDDALAAHEAARLVVIVHPDVRAGKARGHLADIAARVGVRVEAASYTPHAMLDAASAVWTVSSGLGFEALLRGVPVTTFATPFYANWGLSDDRAAGSISAGAAARRGARPTIEALFAAALLAYARYADPVTRRPLDFVGAVARILDWKSRSRERERGSVHCFGFAPWKQNAAARFLAGSQTRPRFHGAARLKSLRRAGLPASAVAAVWGMTDRPGFAEAVARQGCKLLRVEDGFLRSVGLGSDLLAPGSLVLDDLGLYYDARGESRLERILANHVLSHAQRTRAAALRQRLRNEALTKYNLAAAPVDLRALAGGRRVVLIAEQVPGDASLRYGGGDVAGNLDLLQRVRREHGNDFLVYKEHPDLVAGNRSGRLASRRLLAEADLVIGQGDMAALFSRIDMLHVISSLAGFEALLRDVPVTVWGCPFYAGWGLTHDRVAAPRRSRRLDIDELVHGVLIDYPLYGDPVTSVPCGVEDFLDGIAAARSAGGARFERRGLLAQARRLRRWSIAYLRQLNKG